MTTDRAGHSVTVDEARIVSIDLPRQFTFDHSDGSQSVLDWSCQEMTFHGRADEAARQFFDTVIRIYAGEKS